MLTKICTKCSLEKELKYFPKAKGGKLGYSAHCKDCKNLYWRTKYHADSSFRQKENARLRDREVTAREKKHRKEYISNRWKTDEKFRQKIRDRLKWRYHNIPEHKRKQKGYSKVSGHQRKARILGNGGSFTPKEWIELCNRYGNICLCCKKEKTLTVDHVIPISKGGSNNIENIQPLCLDCNLRKWTKDTDYRIG